MDDFKTHIRWMKLALSEAEKSRELDETPVGAVCAVRLGDFINAHRWLNGWSDMPGGWLMNYYDSKNQFRFSISHKKGEYLRNLLRQGRKVVVRAKIDSRYYTDDSLPYATGCIKGTGKEGEEVLIVGHLYEWGQMITAQDVRLLSRLSVP